MQLSTTVHVPIIVRATFTYSQGALDARALLYKVTDEPRLDPHYVVDADHDDPTIDLVDLQMRTSPEYEPSVGPDDPHTHIMSYTEGQLDPYDTLLVKCQQSPHYIL